MNNHVGTATYSPEDNKIRITPFARLDKDVYERLRAAGFIWAPKQGVFVAPMWTPGRADLAEELCGELGDEDTTLVERAETRAERFEGYAERRAGDAENARESVERIADGIPFGQPILVGHHSERHARKDAEKIETGMRRAVKMWETAKYWESRAAGALRHAKYKESPEVRYRRIKTIEADIRAQVASYTPNGGGRIMQTPWNWKPSSPDLTREQRDAEELAARVPHVFVGPKGRGGHWVAEEALPRIKARAERWISHLEMRLAYEKAMLGESGGIVGQRYDIQVGGKVTDRWGVYVVKKLNKKGGELLSVSVAGHSYRTAIPLDEITGYEPPAEGDAEKVKKATKLLPLINYRAPGCVEMTSAEWQENSKYSDSYWVGSFDVEGGYVSRWDKDGRIPAYRQRTAPVRGQHGTRVPVFLTDAKETAPPRKEPAREPLPEILPAVEVLADDLAAERAERLAAANERRAAEKVESAPYDAMKQSLRAGVAVVSAPQLFPTPEDLARKMARMADCYGRVLEPSAGTGVLVRAIQNYATGADNVKVCAVEKNYKLADGLRALRDKVLYANDSNFEVVQGDFLEQNGNLGKFDAVVMNPPFENGADIKHIEHALRFLKPGGRLVAICADGPRQNEKLRPMVEASGGMWEPLPSGTFAGTAVRAVLLTIEAGAQ